MAKHISFPSAAHKEFYDTFQVLTQTRHGWNAWSDFIEAAAIAISNRYERRKEILESREQRYLSIVKHYNKQEQVVFPQLLGILSGALEENPQQDFLGWLFMTLNLNDHWKEQCFTPYHIAEAMARMTIDTSAKEREWFSLGDPCCGAGVMFIAARNYMVEQEIGYDRVLYVGQDIDQTAALMCYLQISLLGCAGYVVVGNSLLHPTVGPVIAPMESPNYDIWYTPLYHAPIWQYRRSLALLELAQHKKKE